MPTSEKQSASKNIDPNYTSVYKGGAQPTLIEKDAAKPPAVEDVFDDCGRVLFGE